MWKLKIAQGGNQPWLRSLNGHTGRQVWVFDPNLGSPEELALIQNARHDFTANRFLKKHSADLLMRLQLSKENPGGEVLPQVKVKDTEDVTGDMVTNTLRRAINFYSTIQAPDGHWPGDSGGPMFLIPGLEIMGVFNRNCMTTYAAYRNIFPIWALGEYRTRVLQPPPLSMSRRTTFN